MLRPDIAPTETFDDLTGAIMTTVHVRDIRPDEFDTLGQLMVDVYSQLDGFPSPDEQPGYYQVLRDIGRFTEKTGVKVLVAITTDDNLAGGVVYFGDMSMYGATSSFAEPDAAGIRLLGVRAECRGMGVGKALILACIDLARQQGHAQVILHSTEAMRVAWQMYVNLGFERSSDLDFLQAGLPVFGFRLRLTPSDAR